MSKTETISEKIERLKAEVEWFYGEDFDLAEAMGKYKEANRLAKEIKEDLGKMKNEIKLIDEDFSR